MLGILVILIINPPISLIAIYLRIPTFVEDRDIITEVERSAAVLYVLTLRGLKS